MNRETFEAIQNTSTGMTLLLFLQFYFMFRRSHRRSFITYLINHLPLMLLEALILSPFAIGVVATITGQG